jgi:hypothetical protein
MRNLSINRALPSPKILLRCKGFALSRSASAISLKDRLPGYTAHGPEQFPPKSKARQFGGLSQKSLVALPGIEPGF